MIPTALLAGFHDTVMVGTQSVALADWFIGVLCAKTNSVKSNPYGGVVPPVPISNSRYRPEGFRVLLGDIIGSYLDILF